MRLGSLLLAVLVTGCAADSVVSEVSSAGQGGKVMAFELKSAAFTAGSNIPKKFTCDGPDVSPALSWSEPPAGTQSLALIMDDPDAPVGIWVHWVL